MSESQVQDLIKKYLSETGIMQMATVQNGQPWICTLHFAADDKGALYWISDASARHSSDIKTNPNVAIAIAVSTKMPLVGIQAEGRASIVAQAKQLKEAMGLYVAQQGTSQAFADQIIAGTNKHKLYVFRPERYNLLDLATFSDGAPQEWIIQ